MVPEKPDGQTQEKVSSMFSEQTAPFVQGREAHGPALAPALMMMTMTMTMISAMWENAMERDRRHSARCWHGGSGGSEGSGGGSSDGGRPMTACGLGNDRTWRKERSGANE